MLGVAASVIQQIEILLQKGWAGDMVSD